MSVTASRLFLVVAVILGLLASLLAFGAFAGPSAAGFGWAAVASLALAMLLP